LHKLFTLTACLLLGACASGSPSPQEQAARTGGGSIAKSNLEAIHNARPIPLPAKWSITANEPRMDFGAAISNYRVFSLQLKKGERYTLNLSTPCNSECLGASKFALKPRALLLDSYGSVIANTPSRAATVVGQASLGWDGEAPEDGTYYLLVAADHEDIGKTIVIEDVWVNNSPLMAVPLEGNAAAVGQGTANPAQL
jgi:hypothetical protein